MNRNILSLLAVVILTSRAPLAGGCQGSAKFLVGFLNLILISDGFLTLEIECRSLPPIGTDVACQ